MTTAIRIDTREFDQALRQYAQATGKDFAHVIHRQLNNVAVKGIQISQKHNASPAVIGALEGQDWWWKWISKIMIAKNASKLAAKMNSGKIKSVKGQARAIARFNQRAFTKAQARAMSRKIIRNRKKAIAFLTGYFALMSKSILVIMGRAPKKGKTFRGMRLMFQKATPKRPFAQWTVWFDYKRPRSNVGADRLLSKTLRGAVAWAIRDMRQYAEQKMARTAKKYSARRAA